MSTAAKFIFGACAVIVLLDAVRARKCYECTSVDPSDDCGDDDFSTSSPMTDKASASLGFDGFSGLGGFGSDTCNYCFKSKSKANGLAAVIRGCIGDLGSLKKDSCQEVEVNSVSHELCTCSTDKCNGVGRLSGSILVVMAITILRYLW